MQGMLCALIHTLGNTGMCLLPSLPGNYQSPHHTRIGTRARLMAQSL
jgi:hypothetical protein